MEEALIYVSDYASELTTFRYFISIIYIHNCEDSESAHSPEETCKSFCQDAEYDKEDAADNEGDAAEPLALFPDSLVLHAPAGPQSHDGIHAHLWHEISDDDHGNTEDSKDNLVKVHGDGGKIFYLFKISVQGVTCHDIEEEKAYNARNDTDIFVIVPVFLLFCGVSCHCQHEQPKENRADREDERFIFTAPARHLVVKIVMCRGLLWQKR